MPANVGKKTPNKSKKAGARNGGKSQQKRTTSSRGKQTAPLRQASGANKATSDVEPETPAQGKKSAATDGETANDDSSNKENARLRAQVAKLQKKLKKRKREELKTTGIVALPRPKGEAGSKKKGFNLQEAMGLKDDPALYRDIVDLVHKKVNATDLDPFTDFRRQDGEKLGWIYRQCRKLQPYLTTERFPNNWAIAEIAKQYLRGQRKPGRRARRLRDKQGDDSEHSSEEDEDSDDDEEDSDDDEEDDTDEDDEDEEEEEAEIVQPPAKKRRVGGVTA